MSSPSWFSRLIARPTPVLAWSVALCLVGAWTATQVPLEWVPKVELPEVRISATWPGSSPRAVERYVTSPIERAVQGVAGTASIESVSSEGRSNITLQVDENVDLGPYVARVNEQVTLLRNDLPDRVVPRLTKRIPEELRDQQGFITLQLIGPQSPGELRSTAEDEVAPRLRSLPGLADVVVDGGTEPEVLVTLDPDRLTALNIEVDAARARLFAATRDAVYGRLQTNGRSVLLLSPAETELERLRDIIVSPRTVNRMPVRLRDVATVEQRAAPRRSISRIDGDPVVTLTLDRAPASPMLDVAEAVRARIATLESRLPDGARLLVATDKSEEVRTQLRDLTWRGGLGLVLVLLVLLVMLRSVRAVGVVLFSVGLALAIAFALMQPLGLTLNLLTIAGLVLVFGLLVDNAVVMAEQVLLQRQRLRGRGMEGAELYVRASGKAMRAVGLPLVGGTVTTIAVMVPIVYLSGELRALFLPFALLTALTLAASLVSAGLLVPVLSRWLPAPSHPRMLPARWRSALQAPYRVAARFPKTSGLAIALLLGTPVWLLPAELSPDDNEWSQPVERMASVYNAVFESDVVEDAREWLDPGLGGVIRPFIEETDFGESYDFTTEPAARVRLTFPPGTPISRADSLLQRFERTALQSSVVRRTVARISEQSAFLRVLFTEGSLNTAEPYIVREQLIQEAVLIAGITVSVSGLLPQGYYSGSGGGISGMSVQAYGTNYDDLDALCERFARYMKRQSRRVASVNTNAGYYRGNQTREELRLYYGNEAQAQTGVSPQRIAARLRPVLTHRFPSFQTTIEGRPRIPVRFIVRGADTLDIRTLIDRPMATSDSAQVKLKSVATYSVEELPARIVREGQQYKRYIRIDYRGPYRMGRDLLEKSLEQFDVPPGYRLENNRGFFFQDEVRTAFGWVVLGTILLVFLATAAVFESWRLPVIVLLSIPTAAVGVAIGFLWAGITFAEGAFIGTVLLVGIAANDSILLVDRYRQLREARPHGDVRVLARLAVRERLRPMWTTTLSSCVAMLPLLVFPQSGDFWASLAVTVTGGLLAATVLAPPASVALIALFGGSSKASR